MLRYGLRQFVSLSLLSPLLYQQTHFRPIPQRINLSEQEQKTIKYWQQIKAFEKQLQKTKHLPPFSFYDGPPFATGTPHYGHIAAGTIKDVVCRYASQTGHYVQRRFGWDCHGLPVQYEIDKQLKITDKKQILDMGIAKYNQACRGIVMRYSKQWQRVVNRFGRWIDFQNDYKTMDLNFMESVWYVFKQLYNRGLVYRGRKIMPYSNACTTVLSNFQVQQNYKQTNDPSIYISFPLRNEPEVKLLAWTTTPWTLPSNLILAVNPQFNYVKVKDTKKGQTFIMAECRLQDYFGKEKYQILSKIKGKQLQGLEYVSLFQFFQNRRQDGCFRVHTASFVTDSQGTGIVHCAPGFGQDDYKLCVDKKIIKPDDPPVPLDENGRFTKQVGKFAGLYIKDADEIIMNDLKEQGRLVRKGTIRHNYPFCWRSETPLIYKAVSTWFIKVTSFRDKLVQNNLKAYWVPKSIQQKKFDNWLKDAKDWCFSRNRFWGNPIPLWISEDGQEIICVGSLQELQQLTGQRVKDLHRENIDGLTIESRQGKGKLRRIQEVFDCWFQSGSMPFAQVHYPFSLNQQKFNKIFPADFIGEGIDQTRGWFYTLNVISTALKNSHPYKNLIVNGLVLTENGKKMSKRLKNYPDPMEVCSELGADAVRLYLINSPLVKAQNLNFSKQGVKGIVRDVLLPWYNAYRFLILNIQKWELQNEDQFIYEGKLQDLQKYFNATDRWIQSSLQELILNVRKEMQDYKLYNVVPPLLKFLDDLTNWYVRLNRGRLKGDLGSNDWQVSLNVLFDVLLKITVLMSPHVPFLTEHMFQNMRLVINPQSGLKQESVHHLLISKVNEGLLDRTTKQVMETTMGIIQTSRKLRQAKKISVKQPLSSIKIISDNANLYQQLEPFLEYIKTQINVENIQLQKDVQKYVKLVALPNLPVLGPKFKNNKDFAKLRQAIVGLSSGQLRQLKIKGHIKIMNYDLTSTDILVQQKFIENSIHSYEAIGGDGVIVVLDLRQNDALRLKGLSRQIITRMQKLKKKASLNAAQDVVFFYEFPQNSALLRKAMAEEGETISKAIKQPIEDIKNDLGLRELGVDIGSIEEEKYVLKLCEYGPVMNRQALQSDFGDEGVSYALQLLDIPIQQLQKVSSVQIYAQEKLIVLKKQRHYNLK